MATMLISCLILLLYLFMSFALARHLSYNPQKSAHRFTLTLPSIVLAPLSLGVSYKVFGLNLLSSSGSPLTDPILYIKIAVASCILLTTSGTAHQIRRLEGLARVQVEKTTLPSSQRALGLQPQAYIGRVIFLRSYIPAIINTTPAALGELMVIEPLLNMPGLGSQLWSQLKLSNSLATDLIVSCGIALCVIATFMTTLAGMNRWMARRMKEYGL